jgi:hypothetical protein
MNRLRNIFLITVFFSLSIFSFASAQMVQIADVGAYQLTQAMNAIAQRRQYEYQINSLEHIGSMNTTNPYDIYMASSGPFGT